MPTYEYKDIEDGQILTVFQSIHDEKLTVHPETSRPIRRIFLTAPAIKSSGFNGRSVNKLSQAATACGCASNVALAEAMFKNTKTTHAYGTRAATKKVVEGVKKSTVSHSHSHKSSSCDHHH
jgi:predicted nucleic acid-binding Zn ribbon protein